MDATNKYLFSGETGCQATKNNKILALESNDDEDSRKADLLDNL